MITVAVVDEVVDLAVVVVVAEEILEEDEAVAEVEGVPLAGLGTGYAQAAATTASLASMPVCQWCITFYIRTLQQCLLHAC